MNRSNFSRLIFMGTPDFALPCLKALLQAEEEVVAVYTQPDRPRGRGQKICPSPIKELAVDSRLPVFQPKTLRDAPVLSQLAEHKPDLLIVVAYGLILPQEVLDVPTWGTVNVHASLLPKYRGAAPIQWAIIKGEKETGVTTMRLDAGLDTGDLLYQQPLAILGTDTTQSLQDRLSEAGATLLVQTLSALRQGTLVPFPQDPRLASYAPPLKKEQGEINWELPAREINGWIRGLTPWPGAFTFCRGKRLLLHLASTETENDRGILGSIHSLPDGLIRVQTGQGLLVLKEVQLEGHRRVSSQEFLKGFPLKIGDRLGRQWP
jgi:methionyl-tRNA formyltransferase